MLKSYNLEFPPDNFLRDETEDSEYYRCFQMAGFAGFDFGYCEIRENEKRIAIAPYFLMQFGMDTMVTNSFLKKVLAPIQIKMACVGHPYADGSIDGEQSPAVLEEIVRFLRQKAGFVVFKGFDGNLNLPNAVKALGLPNSVLRVDSQFWNKMNAKRRRSLRRRLKAGSNIRFIELSQITELLSLQMQKLYLNVYKKAKIKFEQVPIGYWPQMASVSRYLFAFDGDDIIGFVQLIKKKPRMVAHYIGLDYERSQEVGLYYVFLIKIAELAVSENYSAIDFGATSYAFKRSLGCEFEEKFNYYSHSNPVAHFVLRKLRFILEPSKSELE